MEPKNTSSKECNSILYLKPICDHIELSGNRMDQELGHYQFFLRADWIENVQIEHIQIYLEKSKVSVGEPMKG